MIGSAEGMRGFMLGTVLSNSDSKHKGCLKVRLLCEGGVQHVVEGVKVVTAFGGDRYGVYSLPEVGEQVLVGFLEGSTDRPYVLGSVYVAQDKMLSESYHKSNVRKRLVTKGGSVIEVSDEKGKEIIRVQSPDKKLSLELAQKDGAATVTAGKNTLRLDAKQGSIRAKAQKQLVLEAGSAQITLGSDGSVAVKGKQVRVSGSVVKVQSSGVLGLKGQSSTLEGTMTTVKSSGLLQLKGSIAKVN